MKNWMFWLILLQMAVLTGCVSTPNKGIIPASHYDTQTLRVLDKDGLPHHFLLSSPIDSIKNPSEVIITLDGDSLFGAGLRALRLNEVGLGGQPKGKVLVGVGYPDTLLFNPRRSADYTMHKTVDGLIKTTLIPAFSQHQPRFTLVGHSLGGLFALKTLEDCLHQDVCPYTHIVIASPSLWWQDEAALRYWQTLAKPNKKNQPKVTLTVGALEQSPKPSDSVERAKQIQARKMVDNAKALSQRFEALGIEHRFVVVDGVGHQSNALTSLEMVINE